MTYRTSGNKILHNGNEIQIHGVNWIGFETRDAVIGGLWTNQTVPEFLAAIIAQGFNTLRIPVAPRTLQNVDVPEGTAGIWPGSKNLPLLKGKKSLDILDYFIAECEKLGLRYFFDLHYLDANGKIPDLWYDANYSEEQWLEDLGFIAERYTGPGHIGIDLKNEPSGNSANWGKGGDKDWKIAAEKAYQVINAVNQKILVIVEWLGPWSGLKEMTATPLKIPADRLVLSPHVYFASVWQDFGEGFKDPTFPKNMPAIWGRMFGETSKTQAVIIGEWGGKYTDKDKIGQDAFAAYLKSAGIWHHTYWGWGENSGGDCGGILADGSYKAINTDKMKNIATLRTDRAVLSTKTITPKPAPTPTPTPTPGPTPTPTPAPVVPVAGTITKGAIVVHITGTGPRMLVEKVEGDQAQLHYYNDATGMFLSVTWALARLMLVVPAAAVKK